MQKSIEFFNWFSKIGGQMSNFDFHVLKDHEICPRLKKSNLKKKPKKTKKEFNHKFKSTNQF